MDEKVIKLFKARFQPVALLLTAGGEKKRIPQFAGRLHATDKLDMRQKFSDVEKSLSAVDFKALEMQKSDKQKDPPSCMIIVLFCYLEQTITARFLQFHQINACLLVEPFYHRRAERSKLQNSDNAAA